MPSIPDWVDRFPRIGAGSLDLAERVSDAAIAAKDAMAPVAPQVERGRFGAAERADAASSPRLSRLSGALHAPE